MNKFNVGDHVILLDGLGTIFRGIVKHTSLYDGDKPYSLVEFPKDSPEGLWPNFMSIYDSELELDPLYPRLSKEEYSKLQVCNKIKEIDSKRKTLGYKY
jgi:hypothetical protein